MGNASSFWFVISQIHLFMGHCTKRLSSTSSTEESRNENLEKDFLRPLPPSSPPDSWGIWHNVGVDVEVTIFPVVACGVKTRRNLKG